MNKHRIEIINGSGMSIADVKKMQSAGYSLARTSHLGSQYLSNQALLSSGIKAHLYDRNLTMDDRNYWPNHIIVNGRQFPVSGKKNVLTPFGSIVRNQANTEVHQLINGHNNLAALHFSSLEKLYPGLVCTETQFYFRQREVTEEISAIIHHDFPRLFNRRVNSDGSTQQCNDSLSARKFCQLNSNTLNVLQNFSTNDSREIFDCGVLPTLSAVLVINTALMALASDKDIAYELAGPDMAQYSYVDSRQVEVNKVYSKLAESFSGLPERLQLVIVPTFYFRFAALASEMAALDDLVNNLLLYRQIAAQKRTAINHVKQGQRMTAELQDQLKIMSASLSQRTNDLTHQMHESSGLAQRMLDQDNFRDGRFFSHYDVLTANQSLRVNDESLNFSMTECQNLIEVLRQSKRLLRR